MNMSDVIETYRNQLDADYGGEYLNENKLSQSFNYEQVAIKIKPDENEHRVFSGSVRFTGSNRKTFNFEFIELKLSGNFGSHRIKKKLKPHRAEFETSGHNHSFYTDVERVFVDALHANTKLECWVSLLYNYENNFNPEDFGLAVMWIENEKVNLYIKYNAFEWQTTLNYNEIDNQFQAKTQSKKILKNT